MSEPILPALRTINLPVAVDETTVPRLRATKRGILVEISYFPTHKINVEEMKETIKKSNHFGEFIFISAKSPENDPLCFPKYNNAAEMFFFKTLANIWEIQELIKDSLDKGINVMIENYTLDLFLHAIATNCFGCTDRTPSDTYSCIRAKLTGIIQPDLCFNFSEITGSVEKYYATTYANGVSTDNFFRSIVYKRECARRSFPPLDYVRDCFCDKTLILVEVPAGIQVKRLENEYFPNKIY